MAISDTQLFSGATTVQGPFQLWGGRYSFSCTVTATAWKLQRLGSDGVSWVDMTAGGSPVTNVVDLPPGTYQFIPSVSPDSAPGATLELVRF